MSTDRHETQSKRAPGSVIHVRLTLKSRRFKFSLREDKFFNQIVFVDIFYIIKKPVLHVVEEATRYQAAWWLPNVTAESVWRSLRLCWIDIYIGTPDIITHDAGKQFITQVFQKNAELLHIETKCVPIESPNSMSVLEGYHTPIRHACNIVTSEAPDLDEEAALQIAVKSVKDSTGQDGLVPTLLLYGALPRLGFPNDKPTPSTSQRAIDYERPPKRCPNTSQKHKYQARCEQ